MVHFLFYAGKSLKYKLDEEGCPVEEAVQGEYWQEVIDPIYSKYSYEDLPSDKFGADFGANHLDPNSGKSLRDQISDYLKNVLGATNPSDAPNSDQMPEVGKPGRPTATNMSTDPVFTEANPTAGNKPYALPAPDPQTLKEIGNVLEGMKRDPIKYD